MNRMITVHGLGDLDAAAAAVAEAMEAAGATVVTFDGEMGAGKTTLIRRLVSTWEPAAATRPTRPASP